MWTSACFSEIEGMGSCLDNTLTWSETLQTRCLLLNFIELFLQWGTSQVWLDYEDIQTDFH